MKISGFLAKPHSCRTVTVSLLLLGIAFCSVNAKPASNKPVSTRYSEGIGTTITPQPDSPAFIREATFGVSDDTENCTRHCIALDHIVLMNRSEAPITSYRLGWVIVSADAKKPPEVHVGNSIALFKAIGPKQEREFSDNLAPLMPATPAIKLICYFVAEVQQENGRVFTQDRDKIASEQYDLVWSPSNTNE
jgi:hypothetical protein